MKKISIIVPVYNAELYLKKCVDSLLNQTLEEIEIILIDDCSTDNSRSIIEEYYNKNKSKIVAVYLDVNKKQGYVRNKGIEIAKGEYIAFVDSDDYIDEEYCDITYKKAKENDYDIVCFDSFKVFPDTIKLDKLLYDSSITGDIDDYKREKIIKSCGLFWTRIYKRDLLLLNNIKFPVGIFYEDSPFNTLSLLYAKSIAKIDRGLYFYLQRDGSSSNCRNEDRLYNRIDATEFMFRETKLREIYESYRDIINQKYLKMTVGNIHLCLSMFDNIDISKMKEISKNLNYNIAGYKNITQYKELDRLSKLYLNVNQYSPKLLILIDKIYKNILKILKI